MRVRRIAEERARDRVIAGEKQPLYKDGEHGREECRRRVANPRRQLPQSSPLDKHKIDNPEKDEPKEVKSKILSDENRKPEAKAGDPVPVPKREQKKKPPQATKTGSKSG